MKPIQTSTKKILSITVLIVLIALAVFFIYKNIDSFKQQLTHINPLYILVLVFLLLLNYFFIGLINQVLLFPLNVKLKNFETFSLAVVTGFYNLITPFKGGMIARAGYLNKKHNFSYENFLTSLSASMVLIFLVSSLAGMLTTYLIYLKTNIFSLPLFIVFLAGALVMLFIIIFSPNLKPSKNSYLNKIVSVINGWNLIKKNKKVIFSIIILSLMQLLVSSLALFLQFRVFGIDIDFIKCIFLCSIGVFTLLIQITPANLGISESVTVFSALTIGITATQSLTASLLGRAVSFIVLFILGPIFSYYLLKEDKAKDKLKK